MTDITLEQRARELLAAEYEKQGRSQPDIGTPLFDIHIAALRAIQAALRLSAGADAVEPKGWREFIEGCAGVRGRMVSGNSLSAQAKQLLAAAPRHEPGEG